MNDTELEESSTVPDRAEVVESTVLLGWDDVRFHQNGGKYCKKCGVFFGSTCDPFSASHCESCFKMTNEGLIERPQHSRPKSNLK